ncbi:MAG: Gfo/Idh/MocA family oxidoreductase [Bacteroidia bacterium]|nr:Gfo/Idh/MocA family oxidoreductase [Bacteroidia bacterium]
MINKIFFVLVMWFIISCNESTSKPEANSKMVQFITLDPGHFHAALVQKTMYADVDSVVHVYAPAGTDVQLHLDRINAYNTRASDPTHWKEEVYTGDDYLEKMLAEKKGNVVVLSGNNQKKTEYILESLQAGFNVYADKPMVINSEKFEMLKQAFETAKQKNLLLYDIMTERFEITTILQRELSMLPEVFGTLETGSQANPSVEMASRHSFYKYVSGNVLTRPAWFMDASQQGEGIVDVTTHLVDLVQWECFPEQSLDYTKDIVVNAAKRYPTNMTASQFKTITKLDSIPSYFKNNIVKDSILEVYSNGEISYQVRGVHAKVSVQWDYQSPGGTDSHYSMLRGTKATLVIRQGAEQQYKPTLYIEPVSNNADYEKILQDQIKKIQEKYPGVELKKVDKGWEVVIPEKYKEGHEAHFAQVTKNFLEYFKNHNMPEWEVPNMLSKYYTTTKALELARQK